MAQLGDTVVTGSLAVSNCIYGSVTCATTATNACKGWNGSAFASFGSNAFNSTAFTTCVGTVTQVKVGTTAYDPTNGIVSLPAYPSVPTKVSQLTNDSGFTSNTGTVTAITVSVNGVSATSTAGCATASIELTNVPATSACCAKQICRYGYTDCYDFDVALVNGCSSVSDAYIYASASCRLKFCSSKGVLEITDCNGCMSGYMCATLLNSCFVTTADVFSNRLFACELIAPNTLGTVSSSTKVTISVRCGTCSSSCETCFIFCGCDGRMHGNVKGVLNAVTPSSPANGDIWIE